MGGGPKKDKKFIQKIMKQLLAGQKELSIVNDKLGKPSFVINEKIKKIVKKQFRISSFDFFLSISDEKKYSIAYVILQKKWLPKIL